MKTMIIQDAMKPLETPSLTSAGMTPGMRVRRFFKAARELHDRERARMRYEILRIPGLMALLMKPRNGEKWSAGDRAQLRAQMQGLGVLGLYLAMLAIPGTTFTLPLLAWWLDRRRIRRNATASANTDTAPTPPSR